MKPIIIKRYRKYEAEQAVEELIGRGFKVTVPLKKVTSQGKSWDKVSNGKYEFAGDDFNIRWAAQLEYDK